MNSAVGISGMVVGLFGTILGVPLVETTGMAMEVSAQCCGNRSRYVRVRRGMEQLISRIYEKSFQSRIFRNENFWTKSVHKLEKKEDGTSELTLRAVRDTEEADDMVFGSIYPPTVKDSSQRHEAPLIILWRNCKDHDKLMYSTVFDSLSKNHWNIDVAVQILRQSGIKTEPGDIVFLSERIYIVSGIIYDPLLLGSIKIMTSEEENNATISMRAKTMKSKNRVSCLRVHSDGSMEGSHVLWKGKDYRERNDKYTRESNSNMVLNASGVYWTQSNDKKVAITNTIVMHRDKRQAWYAKVWPTQYYEMEFLVEHPEQLDELRKDYVMAIEGSYDIIAASPEGYYEGKLFRGFGPPIKLNG